MEIRTAASPKDVKHYTTERLREEFLIPSVFKKDRIKLVYSHIDRIITGGVTPVTKTLELTAGEELRAEYFLQRREMGVINIGGAGKVSVDGKEYEVESKDGMYIGMGAKDISFASKDSKNPAKFYLNNTPAHCTYPTVLIKREVEAEITHLSGEWRAKIRILTIWTKSRIKNYYKSRGGKEKWI